MPVKTCYNIEYTISKRIENEKIIIVSSLTFELYTPYPSNERYRTPLPLLVPTPSGKHVLCAPLRDVPVVPEIIGPTSLSVAQLKRSYNLNDSVGCAKLGYLYHTGEGVKQDYAKAKEYYSKACMANVYFSIACNNLGKLYEYGEVVTQDYSEAEKYYSKACQDGYNISCTNLGILYSEGKGVEKDSSEAKKYFKRGCNLNDSAG